MTFFSFLRSAAIAGFAFVGAAASATTVTADFTATVSSLVGGTTAAVGDAVTGTLVFDGSASPTSQTTTRSLFDATSLSAWVNGTTFSGADGALGLVNDRPCIAGAEACAFSDQIAANFNRVQGGLLLINITADTTDPLSSDRPALLTGNALSDLIASLASGAVLTEANGVSFIQIAGNGLGPNCGSCQVFATLNTFTIRQPAPDPDPGIDVVPLPAGLPLMLAGLGGLALLRRRR